MSDVEASVVPSSVAAGGDAIARLDDGRVVFVEGAIPGEHVLVRITDNRRDFARARTLSILERSPDRVVPPCPNVERGCGGCPWQHVLPDAQLRLKVDIVTDALRRIGRLALDGVIVKAVTSPATAYRTTIRLAVDAFGGLGYRRRHSHDVIAVEDCLVAHPALSELLARCRFPGATEVTLRVSAASGEALAVVSSRPRGRGPGPGGGGRGGRGRGGGEPARRRKAPVRTWSVPTGVTVVDLDASSGGRLPFLEDVVAGRRWRVSATSFFQPGPAAAESLIKAVERAVGDDLGPGGSIVDAYAGVGVLGGSLVARRGGRLVSVEHHAAAAADARHNLADLDARVVESEVGRWTAERADVVIADPARTGLGRPGTEALAGVGAAKLVLVSCDPASLARDAALLGGHGYGLDGVEVVDIFPHTAHVEAVAAFRR